MPGSAKGKRVAVVGGGPSGATCAAMLAERGLEVTLFEGRASSEKPCGGGVPAHAIREFPHLADAGLPRRVVREVVIYAPSNRSVSVPLAEGIHVFQRLQLDAFLRRRAEAAGAAVRLASVKGVRATGSGHWELASDQGDDGPFDHLVGADGVRGVVRRTMAGPFRDEHLTLALYAYVPGVRRAEMVLKFFGDFDGYLWVFPRVDHVSVGICAPHRSVGKARLEDELHAFVERHYPEGRFPPEALKGYFIPSSPVSPASAANGGPKGSWALVGDAAGFVDRMTREGIAYAMRSGAEVARRLASGEDLATPRLPRNLAWAHRHAAGFFREEFLESMAVLASASSAIRRVLADLFEGKQPYHGLKTRLVLNALPCGLQVGMRSLAAIIRRVR